jgi:transcription-repair coupling factor (superfamily II helicase)
METQSTLLSYLPSHSIVITDKQVDDGLDSFWKEIDRRYEDRRHNVDQPILAPNHLFISTNQVLEQLNTFPRIIASVEAFDLKAGVTNLNTELPPRLAVDPKNEKPFHAVKQYIDAAKHPVITGC